MRAALPLALALAAAACAPLPTRNPLATWVPSPNHEPRRAVLVVLHATEQDSVAASLDTLRSRNSGGPVSAHYLVGRDGHLYQLVADSERAWHAGTGHWGTITDVNSASIGIELDNDGREGYPPVQMDSLLRLLWDLRQRNRLSPASFLGHSDVAPSRKSDPGPLFPWRLLAAYGFGLWCDPPYLPSPPGFDALLGLRAIGYDVRQPAAALAAFRMRYAPGLPTDEPIERDIDLIHCLAQKSLHQ
jgi:N-acetyl-anhydromuramyl-L-alanine amidase AmpD